MQDRSIALFPALPIALVGVMIAAGGCSTTPPVSEDADAGVESATAADAQAEPASEPNTEAAPEPTPDVADETTGEPAEPASDARAALESLEGSWTGYLEYRDFQTDRRVRLPANAFIELAEREPVLTRSIAFTDPGYQVESFDIVVFDGETYAEFGVEEGVGRAIDYTISNFTFNGPRNWRLVLTGRGADAGEPADIQLTQVMNSDTFMSIRRIKPDGADEFVFRNLIRVTRSD